MKEQLAKYNETVRAVIDRLRVILGVSGGRVSAELLEDLAVLNNLTLEEKKAVSAALHQMGVTVCAERELPGHDKVYVEIRSPDLLLAARRISPEEYARRFAALLEAFTKATSLDEALLEQYGEELPILKMAIAEMAEKVSPGTRMRTPRVLARGVLEVSAYRIRDIRNEGWACGTHTATARENFMRFLTHNFSATDMDDLIRYCVKAKADNDFPPDSLKDEQLRVLLHHAPEIWVHRFPRNLTELHDE